ncbi:MAG: DUF3054 domain-containing protein [SAR202 cluster bacterium]|nr:DUF3054 domain-containing protein [SAR202 cluster bacterium]
MKSLTGPWRAALIGDLLVFLLFPLLGGQEHETGVTVDSILRTTVPFAIAWLLIGGAMRAFTADVLRSPGRTLRTVPLAWLIAGILGNMARIVVFDRPFVFAFVVISIGVVLVLLTAWRFGLALLFAARRARR